MITTACFICLSEEVPLMSMETQGSLWKTEHSAKANFGPKMASIEILFLFRQVHFSLSKGCIKLCLEILCM